MGEEQRTLARKVAIGIVGVPLAVGGFVVGVGWVWGRERGGEELERGMG